jgi:hypothetical protein
VKRDKSWVLTWKNNDWLISDPLLLARIETPPIPVMVGATGYCPFSQQN